MAGEFDLHRFEKLIRQAKKRRAEYIAETCGPALKKFGGLTLLIAVAAAIPWGFLRHALANMVGLE
jgi:hypothetical protein